jgi:hypothetical protein
LDPRLRELIILQCELITTGHQLWFNLFNFQSTVIPTKVDIEIQIRFC